MLRTISGLSLGIVLLAAACGNPSTTPDLATSPDLLPPTIPVPVGCNTGTAVTGTIAYATITAANGQRCMGPSCHNNAQRPTFSTQATFMAAMVNQASASSFQFVVPNMPNSSYLLYKLRNLQQNVPGGGGSRMPLGGTPLTDAEFCTVYAWVQNGAPVN